MSDVDPSVLLSALAQSGAVLVGIIGGLIAQQLISLSIEKDSNRERMESLESNLHDTKDKLKRQKKISRDLGIALFVKYHLSRLIESRGNVDIGTLLEEYSPRGLLSWQARTMAAEVAARVRRAFDRVESFYPSTELPATGFAELRKRIGPFDKRDREIYLGVARALADNKMSVTDSLAPAPSGKRPLDGVSFEEYQRYEDSLREELRLGDREDVLSDEFNTLLVSFRRITRPKEIWPALAALMFFAVTGIAFPMVLMAVRPVPDSAIWRGIEVGAFLLGLVVLLAYFAWMRRDLRK